MCQDHQNLGPQDAHFSKRQLSLHCTVAHHPEYNTYIYHLSDNRKHNHCFTNVGVKSLIDCFPDIETYQFKSENCKEQYKRLNIVPLFCKLAIEHKKMFIYYYGVNGHGKRLVDAMSGFGLKTLLQKAIVTEDFFYDSAQKVYKCISEKIQSVFSQ